MRYLIPFLAAASLLSGCSATSATSATTATTATSTTSATSATPATQDAPMTHSATLLPQRTVEAAAGTTLRYDGAADSRCPPDVRCIVAGEISYQFTLLGSAGSESFNLSKNKPSFDASTFKGVRVTLGETAEPPLRPSTASTPVVIMPVTVNISRP
jgi:hypothetical protein